MLLPCYFQDSLFVLAFNSLFVSLCGSICLSHMEFVRILGLVDSYISSNLRHFHSLLFKIFFLPHFPLSYPSGISIMHMLACLMLFHKSVSLCLLIFIYFSFCYSDFIIPIIMFSCLLMLFSSCKTFLLNPCSELIFLVIVLFSFRNYALFLFIIFISVRIII